VNEDYYHFDIVSEGQTIFRKSFHRQGEPIIWRVSYYFRRIIRQSILKTQLFYNDSRSIPLNIVYDNKTNFILSVKTGKKVLSIKKEMTEVLLDCFHEFKKQDDRTSEEKRKWHERYFKSQSDSMKNLLDFISMVKKIRPEFFL
jgi:hypothetical protein